MGMIKCPLCKKEYYEKDIVCPTCFLGIPREQKEIFAEWISNPEMYKVMSMTPSQVKQVLDDEDDKKAAKKEMIEEPKAFNDKISPEFREIMSLIREIPIESEEAIIFDDYFHGSRLNQPERVQKALIRLNEYFPNEGVVLEELKKLNSKLQRKEENEKFQLQPRLRSQLLGKIFDFLKDNSRKAFTVTSLNNRLENILDDLNEREYCKINLQSMLNELISAKWIKSTQHMEETHYFFT